MVALFVYSESFGVLYDFQAINRSVLGAGGDLAESFLFPIGRPGVIYDSYQHSNAFVYVVARIRVNLQ